jgi:hypothetical protein
MGEHDGSFQIFPTVMDFVIGFNPQDKPLPDVRLPTGKC